MPTLSPQKGKERQKVGAWPPGGWDPEPVGAETCPGGGHQEGCPGGFRSRVGASLPSCLGMGPASSPGPPRPSVLQPLRPGSLSCALSSLTCHRLSLQPLWSIRIFRTAAAKSRPHPHPANSSGQAQWEPSRPCPTSGPSAPRPSSLQWLPSPFPGKLLGAQRDGAHPPQVSTHLRLALHHCPAAKPRGPHPWEGGGAI